MRKSAKFSMDFGCAKQGHMSNSSEQVEKFKGLAREVEAEENEACWHERLAKVAKTKPAPEKPE